MKQQQGYESDAEDQCQNEQAYDDHVTIRHLSTGHSLAYTSTKLTVSDYRCGAEKKLKYKCFTYRYLLSRGFGNDKPQSLWQSVVALLTFFAIICTRVVP